MFQNKLRRREKKQKFNLEFRGIRKYLRTLQNNIRETVSFTKMLPHNSLG
nr:MAG TPA: hypothetical protein [Bacteriophage sp.]